MISEFGGKPFSEFKPALADLAVEKLAPISAKMRDLLAEPDEIDKILSEGADKAREIAVVTMREVREIFGFVGTK